MKKDFFTAWAWGPLVVAAALMTAIYLFDMDQHVFLALNHAGYVMGEAFWANLTMLGDGAVALSFILLFIRRSPQRFWAALIAAVLVSILVQVIKHQIVHLRPATVFAHNEFFQFGPRLRHSSFPSGHAAAIFTLTGIWILSVSKHYLLRIFLFSIAVLVGASRIMVGVHWPLDVLAGMLIGWTCAYIGLCISARHDWRTDGKAGLLAGLLLAIISVSLLFSTHTGFPLAMPLQRTIGAFCLIFGILEIHSMRKTGELKKA